MSRRLVAPPGTCTGNKCFVTRNFRKAIAMAKADERHEWRVDDSCIGCGASVSVAPELIVWSGEQVRFARQPSSAAEESDAWAAALVSPTAYIKFDCGGSYHFRAVE